MELDQKIAPPLSAFPLAKYLLNCIFKIKKYKIKIKINYRLG